MKRIGILVLSLLIVLSLGFAVFAGDKQLALDTTSIEDGAKAVSLNPEFKLVFTNNVVNMKVKGSNISAIRMDDADGNSVELIVEMADDQVNPEEKRNVIVKAQEALEADKSYTLLIGKSFSGKNGSSLKEDIKINFTTEGGKKPMNGIAMGAGVVVILGALVGFSRRKK